MAALAMLFIPSISWAGEVRVAVASNFRPALIEVAALFERQTNHTLIIVSGSTGKLYTQIRHGAPFDVFLSADQHTASRLVREGIAAEESQFTYARGALVLWHRGTESLPLDWLEAAPARIAIAHPDLAPYGQAAQQVLARPGSAEHHIIRGENVSQALQFAVTGHVDAALVARSLALLAARDGAGTWTAVPEEWYQPLDQDAVLLTRAAEDSAARDFLAFLVRPETRALLHDLGYEVP